MLLLGADPKSCNCQSEYKQHDLSLSDFKFKSLGTVQRKAHVAPHWKSIGF